MGLSSETNVHRITCMAARHFASNGGMVAITCYDGGGSGEGFEVAFFTGKPALAVALTDAINNCLREHGFLEESGIEPLEGK